MNVELVTKNDLENLKDSLLKEMRAMMGSMPVSKKWLKSSEVREILACSPGTLQNLRVNGTLSYKKIGGTLYYSEESVSNLFSETN